MIQIISMSDSYFYFAEESLFVILMIQILILEV